MPFQPAIKFYHCLGKGLYGCRLLIILLVVLGISSSIFLVFSTSELSERYLLLTLLFTTWLILLLSLAYFRADDLVLEQEPTSWIKKISHSLRMAFGILLAAAFTILGLILLWISISTILRLYN